MDWNKHHISVSLDIAKGPSLVLSNGSLFKVSAKFTWFYCRTIPIENINHLSDEGYRQELEHIASAFLYHLTNNLPGRIYELSSGCSRNKLEEQTIDSTEMTWNIRTSKDGCFLERVEQNQHDCLKRDLKCE